MNGKCLTIATPGSGNRFPGRGWLVGWTILSLTFCPTFPGGQAPPLPLAQMALASGEYYDGAMGDPGYMEGGYDYYSQDSDGDGWSDGDESNAGTDPHNPASYPGAVDPAEMDSDGDGLTDARENSGFEIEFQAWAEDDLGYYNEETGTVGFWMVFTMWVYPDPAKADTDGDLLPDGWEVSTPGFDPTSAADGLADPDLDGLGTGEEWLLGTDWRNPDSDGDGFPDGVEVLELATDPTDPADPLPAEEPTGDSGDGGGGGGGGGAGMDGGGSPGGTGTGGGTTGGGGGTTGGEGADGTQGGDGGTDGGGDGEAVDSGAEVRLMGRTIQTSSFPTWMGNSNYSSESSYSSDPSPEEMSGEGYYSSDTWIEDSGWSTVLNPGWNSRKTLAEGQNSTSLGEILVAHATAAFPGSAPDDEEGWGDYTGGRIEARAYASTVVGGDLGGPQTTTYYEVGATKIEVRLLAPAPVEQTLRRSFLKGTMVDDGQENFETVTLTIEEGGIESERILLDPDIMLGKTSVAHLIPVELVPDYNRDGRIGDQDRGKVSKDDPWRWWVNDDNDSGEYGASVDKPDVPGAVGSDHSDGAVDGIRDLVDFFPLHLDLRQAMEVFPSSEYQYFLRQESPVGEPSLGALWYPSAHLDRDPGELYSVGGFLRNPGQAADAAARPVEAVTSDGVRIPDIMLDVAQDGRGMVLIEGKFINHMPLVVEIRTPDGTPVAGIKFPVKIAKVEEMYRHVDLRTVPVNPDGGDAGNIASPLPAKTGDPGYSYPDALTNGKYFVFVHGYNVSGEKARGWFAELFKRMHQMGSRARFVGVSWRGDAGLGPVDLPFLDWNINYHKPVFFALQTGDALADALDFTASADVTVAAHSLGNMVVSHAIADGGFSPSRYYMVDAAVAKEAYDSGNIPGGQAYRMTEKNWKPYLETIGGPGHKVTAARWYGLFDTSDGRNDLTWVDRFAKVTQKAYHFYSTGEEVLQNPELGVDSAFLLEGGLSGAVELAKGRRSWVAQEYSKGTDYAASATQDFTGLLGMPSLQAGWGFADRYYVAEMISPDTTVQVLNPPTPAAAAALSETELRENPIFREFLEEGLTDPALGSALAEQRLLKYQLLASGIPALSYAAGSNPIGGGSMEGRNFNMPGLFQTPGSQWPTEGHPGLSSGNWLHSDFYGVALSHVYKMYEKMIELGKLDDENEN